MKFNILLICILLVLAIPAESSERDEYLLAVWYNADSKRYALALDLSMGYYPSEGQNSFSSLDDLIGHVNGIFAKDHPSSSKQERVKRLIVNNGNPHGNRLRGVRKIGKDEFKVFLEKTQSVELVW